MSWPQLRGRRRCSNPHPPALLLLQLVVAAAPWPPLQQQPKNVRVCELVLWNRAGGDPMAIGRGADHADPEDKHLYYTYRNAWNNGIAR